MRSQNSKSPPKKGAQIKTSVAKASKPGKKKVVSTSKVKKNNKKSPPKPSKKIDSKSIEKQNESSNNSENKTESNNTATTSVKVSAKPSSRSNSPNKKGKPEIKDKKETSKISSEVTKKSPIQKITNDNLKPDKKTKSNTNKRRCDSDSDSIKYKINAESKKSNTKFSKAKNVVKKGQKKVSNKQSTKPINTQKESPGINKNEQRTVTSTKNDESSPNKNADQVVIEGNNLSETNDKNIKDNNSSSPNSVTSNTPPSSETTERPPKFFTSSRAPRMVDIDVKCCKNSKGNLSVSERFVSLKCVEPKNDDVNKDKSSSTLVSQGPEIDVYTFTEKVDSPKSILPEFRNTTNKSINRVRPIARVKGTIIDKNAESERKKYSPHRPIEEVVKQLKANKNCEEVKSTPTLSETDTSTPSAIKSDEEEKPKPIVSKSYKMVARKSSIPGKPFSPIKFLEQDISPKPKGKNITPTTVTKKTSPSPKKKSPKINISDEEIETSKFSLNTKSTVIHDSSSDDSENDDTKESSESDTLQSKSKTKKYKRKKESPRKKPTKEQPVLEKPVEIIEIKEEPISDDEYEQPSKRRLKLISMWNGPKQHRMASLNALAKVHCLYENESRTHMELGLMKTVDRPVAVAGCSTAKSTTTKKKEEKSPNVVIKQEYNSESEYESPVNNVLDSSEEDVSPPNTRTLRGVTGMRSAGKYWEFRTSSSEDSEAESKKKPLPADKKKTPAKTVANKTDSEKPPAKVKKLSTTPRKKRTTNEVVMDLKDMVVQKRMASLNATAILAASYEKRSPKSSKDDTTSDSCSDESFFQKSKNGVSSGVKSEAKVEDGTKKEVEDVSGAGQQKVEVIVNQDTDVTITGVYSTHHHEGFCTVSGMQYRISSTSHTQTTATSNCEKEECARDEGTARYTPLSALSSMQPPLEQHPPAPELGNLTRRAAGCSSAFTAPPPAGHPPPHHDPGKPTTSGLGMFEAVSMTPPTGYYQPAGPLIKETNEAERSLARYHPPPHYHAPHPPVMQQYGPPYYPDLCYGRYYRPPGPYHMPPPPPNPDPQMVGVGNEPYTPPPYYSGPPCYQHSPQRVPYIEYRCPCPMNTCPKNVLIGPATGKAPTGGGPDVASALTQPGAAFRTKVQAACADHGSGKDPPPAADAPRPFAAQTPGPPSPARGSAGACPPQPPTVAPRRARLGKAMARRSLADTGALMQTARAPPEDDDVLAISPPASAPIDLSSSDETTTPIRRLSKLEIDVGDEGDKICETNGIGEHVKLQKRRKIIPEKVEVSNNNVLSAENKIIKKKSPPKVKKPQVTLSPEKKVLKRKNDNVVEPPRAKKALIETPCVKENTQIKNISPLGYKEQINTKPKSALILDDLIKKNSIDRPEAKFHPVDDVDPVELFLSPSEQAKQHDIKPALNINNNIVENNNVTVNGARSKTISAVNQHITKKLATPTKGNLETEKDSGKINHTTLTQLPGKPVLKPTDKVAIKETEKTNNNLAECQSTNNKVKPKISKPEKVPKPQSISVNNIRKNKINAISDKLMIEKSQKSAISVVPTDKLIYSAKTKPVEETETKAKPVEAVIPKPTLPEKETENNNKIMEKEIVEKDCKGKTEEKQTVTKIAKRSKLSIDKADLKEKCSKNLNLKVLKKPVIKSDETTSIVEEACGSPVTVNVCAKVRRRRRRSGACMKRVRRMPALVPPPVCLSDRAPPRWSNGWRWDGEHFLSKVYVNNDSRLDRMAHCWPRMHHESGDQVSRGDCVLLRASPAKAQPFVARVAHLWENPEDGEMMVSLVWYYRPEHTEKGRSPEDAPDEVFASRHRDANSVACIEDKCHVLTYNEYCRYRKKLKATEEGITISPSIVPPMPASEVFPAVATNDTKLPPTVSPELVLFCRKIYDFRSKKILDGTRSRVTVLKN